MSPVLDGAAGDVSDDVDVEHEIHGTAQCAPHPKGIRGGHPMKDAMKDPLSDTTIHLVKATVPSLWEHRLAITMRMDKRIPRNEEIHDLSFRPVPNRTSSTTSSSGRPTRSWRRLERRFWSTSLSSLPSSWSTQRPRPRMAERKPKSAYLTPVRAGCGSREGPASSSSRKASGTQAT
jgi:hypothetical protein